MGGVFGYQNKNARVHIFYKHDNRIYIFIYRQENRVKDKNPLAYSFIIILRIIYIVLRKTPVSLYLRT